MRIGARDHLACHSTLSISISSLVVDQRKRAIVSSFDITASNLATETENAFTILGVTGLTKFTIDHLSAEGSDTLPSPRTAVKCRF